MNDGGRWTKYCAYRPGCPLSPKLGRQTRADPLLAGPILFVTSRVHCGPRYTARAKMIRFHCLQGDLARTLQRSVSASSYIEKKKEVVSE